LVKKSGKWEVIFFKVENEGVCFCKKSGKWGCFFCKKVENWGSVKSGSFLNAGCIMYSITIFYFTFYLGLLGGAYVPNPPSLPTSLMINILCIIWCRCMDTQLLAFSKENFRTVCNSPTHIACSCTVRGNDFFIGWADSTGGWVVSVRQVDVDLN